MMFIVMMFMFMMMAFILILILMTECHYFELFYYFEC